MGRHQELAADASITYSLAQERSRARGRMLAPQDIAAALAEGPFKKAFGDKETRRRIIDSFDDWARFGDDIDLTINLAVHNARTQGRVQAENIDLLTAVINPNGEPIEPLTLLIGDRQDPHAYRMSILKRAIELTNLGQDEQLQRVS